MDLDKELLQAITNVQNETRKIYETSLLELAHEIEEKIPQTEYYKGYKDGLIAAAQLIKL